MPSYEPAVQGKLHQHAYCYGCGVPWREECTLLLHDHVDGSRQSVLLPYMASNVAMLYPLSSST